MSGKRFLLLLFRSKVELRDARMRVGSSAWIMKPSPLPLLSKGVLPGNIILFIFISRIFSETLNYSLCLAKTVSDKAVMRHF